MIEQLRSQPGDMFVLCGQQGSLMFPFAFDDFGTMRHLEDIQLMDKTPDAITYSARIVGRGGQVCQLRLDRNTKTWDVVYQRSLLALVRYAEAPKNGGAG
jgi:hypothetical protein